jgi:hypothetical protein
MTKTQFHELTTKLVSLGENQEELAFWENIFDDMQPDNKDILVALLSQELKDLEKAKK